GSSTSWPRPVSRPTLMGHGAGRVLRSSRGSWMEDATPCEEEPGLSGVQAYLYGHDVFHDHSLTVSRRTEVPLRGHGASADTRRVSTDPDVAKPRDGLFWWAVGLTVVFVGLCVSGAVAVIRAEHESSAAVSLPGPESAGAGGSWGALAMLGFF